jgi:hypothetical protein
MLDNFMSGSSSMSSENIGKALRLCRRSDKFPCGLFGKLLAYHPEPFVNQFAFAIVEIQSQVRWYADCNNCQALGSPGFAKGGGPKQVDREPSASSLNASKCVDDDRSIFRSRDFRLCVLRFRLF